MSKQLLFIGEVSKITQVPVETLRRWRKRRQGEGPPPARVGARVMYRITDVDAWVDQQFELEASLGNDSSAPITKIDLPDITHKANRS